MNETLIFKVTHYGAVLDDHMFNNETLGIFVRQKIYKFDGAFYIHSMYNGETILFKPLQRDFN